MDDVRFGAALRSARIRRGWRQVDVAASAKVSDATVSRIERGHLGGMRLRSIRAVAAALEVSVELQPRSRAASLERIVNQAHASLAEQVLRWISTFEGWLVRPEVSFSHYGERGVIDLLGWHAATRSVLVIELKTEIVDVGELLGTFDRKLRNVRPLVRAYGWNVQNVSGMFVIGEGDLNRRRVATHAATFAAAFPDRIVRVRRWLAAPDAPIQGLVFFANRHRRQAGERLTTIRRVRRAGCPSGKRRATVSRVP